MPAATYAPNGTVTAIQWTGSNLPEIQAAAPGFTIFTTTSNSGLKLTTTGMEPYSSDIWVPVNSWLVSQPAYTGTPTFTGGFNVIDDVAFTQQYKAA